MGGKVRLPEPPRKLGKADVAIVRGHADSIALRIACHDATVHRRLQPAGQQARAVFEAVEQARVEAIGARRMDGVAQNLTAMLDERFHRGKFDDITDRADAPIEDALALMVRERLTGLAPPQAAQRLVDLWRPLIEDRAGRDLDRLATLLEDQRQFGDAVHDLLDALEMGEDRSRDSEDEERGRREDRRKQESGEDGGSADSDEMPAGCLGGHAGVRRGHARCLRRGRRCAERRHGRRHRPGRRRDPGGATAAAPLRRQRAARAGLSRLHGMKFDEVVAAERSMRRRGA